MKRLSITSRCSFLKHVAVSRDKRRKETCLMKRLILVLAILLVGAQSWANPKVTFVEGKDKVDVMIGSQRVARYVFDSSLPKPSLVNVATLSGREITRRWPLTELAGGSMDHEHHVGVFFCVDGVNGTNFWNYYRNPDGKEPKIRHVRFDKIESSDKHDDGKGVLKATSHWIDKHGDFLLEEKRTMTFSGGPSKDTCVIELEIDLTAQTKVVFEDIEEGVLGIRLSDYLRETDNGVLPKKDAPLPKEQVKGTGRYFSSTGMEMARNIWGKRHRWVALQGIRGGKVAGIAVFDHPDSINHPTYWHVRKYGLLSVNPLGQGDFQRQQPDRKNPVKPFRLTLEKGQTAHFRFMIVLFDGVHDEADVEGWYRRYAK